MDVSTRLPKHVDFAQSCVLILDHELQIPGRQGISAAVFLRGLVPRTLGLGFHTSHPSLRSSPHPRRSSSGDDGQRAPPTPDVVIAGPSSPTSPRMGVRKASNASTRKTSFSSVQSPPRSCLKEQHDPRTSPVSPTFPGAFNTSPSSPQPRDRSSSSATTRSYTQSPISAPPHIPTETIPLRPCCDECIPASHQALSQGKSYRIHWSAAAAAKKRRDDAEARSSRDQRKWMDIAQQKSGQGEEDEEEDEEDSTSDDGFAKPGADDLAEADQAGGSACTGRSSHALDPLSKLDGTAKLSKSSCASLNKDWAPEKYYDAADDEDDLFPLPSPTISPRATPISISPASSSTNLSPIGRRPVSPGASITPTGEADPVSLFSMHPAGRYGNELGLPAISGSPRMASSRSSSSSSADSRRGWPTGVRTGQIRRPSPLRDTSSPDISPMQQEDDRDESYTSVAPPSVTTSSASGRSWTSSFVPPPLPNHLRSPAYSQPSTRKLMQSEGMIKSPLTRPNTSRQPTIRIDTVRKDRYRAPALPSPSSRKEIIVVASSSSKKERPTRRYDMSSPTSEPPNAKKLPPLPEAGADSGANRQASSRSSTMDTSRNPPESSPGRSDLVDEFGQAPYDRRASAFTSDSKTTDEDETFGKRAAQAARSIIHSYDTGSEVDRQPFVAQSPSVNDEDRLRARSSSSIRRLWKGLGSITSATTPNTGSGAVHVR